MPTLKKSATISSIKKLVKALEENNIDYKFFELSHSGHGLQNDNKVYQEYIY